MKIKQLAVAIAALALATAAQASDSPAVAKAKLEKVLTCEQGADPEEVATLIKTLGGLPVVQASPLSDAEYTVPNPVELFGRPVTKISIHRGMNADGDFNEYGALFSGESIDTVAKIAGITPDAAGTYNNQWLYAFAAGKKIPRSPGEIEGGIYLGWVLRRPGERR